MMHLYLLLIICTLAAAFASFFLKKSVQNNTFFDVFRNRYLYLGGFLYTLGAFLGILLLKRMDFSIFVPLGSITYIWVMIISRLFLKERIGTGKIIGVLLIISGVVCITYRTVI